jgi:hypothetical protein
MEVSGQLHGPDDLLSRKEPPVPIGYMAGSAPEPVWILWRKNNLFPLLGIESGRPTRSQSIMTELSWFLLTNSLERIVLNARVYINSNLINLT